MLTLAEHDDVVEALATNAAESQKAFIRGVRTAVRNTRMTAPFAARSNSTPNLSSLSRMRNGGPSPNGVAFRSCRATYVVLGLRVTPACMTVRGPVQDLCVPDSALRTPRRRT
jgi:hypothetical protein